ncbi:MAG: HNH endonuclease [Chloroflexi bacterium HGW-Chloroflexi-1]|nr:MAG: HNH endonuclease [Chloroflexi bacterium HGW-Chloroflexi-1]
MTYVPARLRDLVVTRARASCEYCLLHADYAVFAHEVDHVIARQHGGATSADNLAYACAQCNRFKGSNVAAPDLQSGIIVPLFNPRTQSWRDHFHLDGPLIVPLSIVGRVTERLLQLNQLDRVLLRKELIAVERYPFRFGEAMIT